MKPVAFLGDALDRLRAFPNGPRRDAGYQLERVQRGLDPSDWKPMASIAPGVREIRVFDSTGAYRVLYVATFREAVYVLPAFAKKTRKTSPRDIEITARRLRQLKHGTSA